MRISWADFGSTSNEMNTFLIVVSVLAVGFGIFCLTKWQQSNERQIENANRQNEALQKDMAELRDYVRQLEQANPMKVHHSVIQRIDNVGAEIAVLETYLDQDEKMLNIKRRSLATIKGELTETRKPNGKKQS